MTVYHLIVILGTIACFANYFCANSQLALIGGVFGMGHMAGYVVAFLEDVTGKEQDKQKPQASLGRGK